jgi:hypothetical protein
MERRQSARRITNSTEIITLEEAWAVLRNENYKHQYEDGWQTVNPE